MNLMMGTNTARPYESCENIEGLPPRDAPWKLVQLWYRSFPLDRVVHENEKPNHIE